MAESFLSFISRHRFNVTDILSHRHLTRHDYELALMFPGMDFFWLDQKQNELERLGLAFAIAGYVAECETDEPELFSKAASALSDDEWNYTLQFCPYYSVDSALKNLALILYAMEETCLNLNAAKAGMEIAMEYSTSGVSVYSREQSKATSQLLCFVALYASYIDGCRRIREKCKLKGSEIYDRAIARIVGKKADVHSFVKDLRNFTLHYQIPEPSVTIQTSDKRVVSLNLNGVSILYSGFRWKRESKSFLQNNPELEVVDTVSIITRDVRRLVKFHNKLVSKRLVDEKFAFETYANERSRLRHLLKATMDIGAVFKRPTSLIVRLLDAKIVDQVLKSALSNKISENLLVNIANRHRNLPKGTLNNLREELQKALSKRPNYPVGKPFLSRRRIK